MIEGLGEHHMVRRFWISDYPVLGYLAYGGGNGEQVQASCITMLHLADKREGQVQSKTFPLGQNEEFISFVD